MATQGDSQQLCGEVFHRSPLGAVRREDHVVAEVETEAYTVELRTTGEQRVPGNEGLAYRTPYNQESRTLRLPFPGLYVHLKQGL